MRKFLVVFLIALTITFSFKVYFKITDLISSSQPIWPMYKYDRARTGRCPYDTSDNTGKVRWKFEAEDTLNYAPVIDSDGTIYVGGQGYLYAIKPDGTLKWKFQKENHYFHVPAIGLDGKIYVACSDGYLYALRPDGNWVWKFDTGYWSKFFSAPAIGQDGTIYFGVYKYLYAFDPNTRSLKWKFKAGDTVFAPAIGQDGRIYVSSEDGYLYAFKPDGNWVWKFPGPSLHKGIYADPVIGSDGTIYFGYHESPFELDLCAFKSDGTPKWSIKLGELRFGEISIDTDGTIYVGSADRELTDYINAVNPNGTLKWRVSVAAPVSAPAIGSDGTFYVSSEDNYLYAFNRDGTLKWKFKPEEKGIGVPIIGSDGTVYITSTKYLYALNWLVKLTSPNGGEEFESGKTCQIRWQTYSTGGYIKLFYSTDSGSNWTKITCLENSNTSGSYNWNIPSNINTNKARIKIVILIIICFDY
jgi:outer membrane protein assembly factor BamB